MSKKKTAPDFLPPLPDERRVLLHACCAPCSSAIVECLLQHGLQPTLFYCNPNIWPRSEYDIRLGEAKRFAREQGIGFVEVPYDHERWLERMRGLEEEPERGRRCQLCFRLRLEETARYARGHGFRLFGTTLASSRWKSLEQIDRAGHDAEAAEPGTCFWAENWRRGGLQERRNQLLREYGFYNQLYCGCEFSAARMPASTSAPRPASPGPLPESGRESG